VSWVPAALVAAAGGAALAVALHDSLGSIPALSQWAAGAYRALIRVGREGRLPTDLERRRAGLAAGGALALIGTLLLGPGPATVLGGAGPALAGRAIGTRHRRYRERVETEVPAIGRALADALTAGGSLRGALLDAAPGFHGPAGAELARVRAELELGAPVRAALAGMVERLRSPRIAGLARVVLSQERSGGDLAALLRRHADAVREQQRALADARSATAQARLTGGMVAAMPVGAVLLVELMAPGFTSGMLSEPAAALLLGVAVALQAAGFALIRRMGRVRP
jgi:tight adherence protein B